MAIIKSKVERKSRVYTYQVRTSPGIAKEMARYEANTVVAKTDQQLPAFCDPDDPEDVDRFATFVFTIQGNYPPCLGRWASFGIPASKITLI